MNSDYWRGKAFAFFSNSACESFPCHAAEVAEDFNCLFCYCPLYVLGDQCGGNFSFLDNGIKDCSNCTLPHERDNYGLVTEKLRIVVELVKAGRNRG